MELVLAIYPDEEEERAYRAVCTGVSDIDCKIFFIDYGSKLQLQGFDKIWKMPQEFVKECMSVNIKVKLQSGKALKNVDVDKTMELLANAQKIETFVELENGKQVMTLDDKLVAFK